MSICLAEDALPMAPATFKVQLRSVDHIMYNICNMRNKQIHTYIEKCKYIYIYIYVYTYLRAYL